MIEAPEVISKLYESQSPHIVKNDDKILEINIILNSEFDSFCAMYIGIVKSAITKIKPTIFIATTTVKAESTKIRV